MVALSLRHFDALGYVENSKALGVDENIAKYQARQFEQVLEIAVTTSQAQIDEKELATKHDIAKLDRDIIKLERDIKEIDLKIEQTKKELKIKIRSEANRAKYEMIVWVAGMFIASGLIQHFFK